MPKRRDPNMLAVKKAIEQEFGGTWINSGRGIWWSRDGRRISRVNGDPTIKLIGGGEPRPVPEHIKEAIQWLTNSTPQMNP